MLQLMDTYAASWCVILMALTECIVISWVYGKCCPLLTSGWGNTFTAGCSSVIIFDVTFML